MTHHDSAVSLGVHDPGVLEVQPERVGLHVLCGKRQGGGSARRKRLRERR